MQLPVKDIIFDDYPAGSVTQWYGENPHLYQRFGLAYHNGIDIVAPWGTPMYAIEKARVVDVKLDPGGYGMHIRIRSLATDENGRYRCWTYGHCSKIVVSRGEEVEEGQYIADMGNTGYVISGNSSYWKYNPYAGTHLHLGLRFLIPDDEGWRFPGDIVKYRVYDYENGVKGALDPMIILKDLKPGDRRPVMLTLYSVLNQLVAAYEKLKMRS